MMIPVCVWFYLVITKQFNLNDGSAPTTGQEVASWVILWFFQFILWIIPAFTITLFRIGGSDTFLEGASLYWITRGLPNIGFLMHLGTASLMWIQMIYYVYPEVGIMALLYSFTAYKAEKS